jgi:hypothetical protein
VVRLRPPILASPSGTGSGKTHSAGLPNKPSAALLKSRPRRYRSPGFSITSPGAGSVSSRVASMRSWSTANLNLVGRNEIRSAMSARSRRRATSIACAASTKRRRSRCTLRHGHHPASAPAPRRRCYDWPRWITKVKPTPDYRRSSSRVSSTSTSSRSHPTGSAPVRSEPRRLLRSRRGAAA